MLQIWLQLRAGCHLSARSAAAWLFFCPPDIMWMSSLCLAGFVFPGLPSNSASELLIRRGTAPNAGTLGTPGTRAGNRGPLKLPQASEEIAALLHAAAEGRVEVAGGVGARGLVLLTHGECPHFHRGNVTADCALRKRRAHPQVWASLRLLPAVWLGHRRRSAGWSDRDKSTHTRARMHVPCPSNVLWTLIVKDTMIPPKELYSLASPDGADRIAWLSGKAHDDKYICWFSDYRRGPVDSIQPRENAQTPAVMGRISISITPSLSAGLSGGKTVPGLVTCSFAQGWQWLTKR